MNTIADNCPDTKRLLGQRLLGKGLLVRIYRAFRDFLSSASY